MSPSMDTVLFPVEDNPEIFSFSTKILSALKIIFLTPAQDAEHLWQQFCMVYIDEITAFHADWVSYRI